MLKAVDNQPNDREVLKDLQDSIADLYLAGKPGEEK